jgi:hypothetical protein
MVTHESSCHVFGLARDKTLHITYLFALEQNVGNVAHYVAVPSINLPPSQLVEPFAPKMACNLGLNLNKLSS